MVEKVRFTKQILAAGPIMLAVTSSAIQCEGITPPSGETRTCPTSGKTVTLIEPDKTLGIGKDGEDGVRFCDFSGQGIQKYGSTTRELIIQARCRLDTSRHREPADDNYETNKELVYPVFDSNCVDSLGKTPSLDDFGMQKPQNSSEPLAFGTIFISAAKMDALSGLGQI